MDLPSWYPRSRARTDARGESGQTLVEYAMLIGLITITLVLAVTSVGLAVNGLFASVPVGL